jgi:hypothetical protein
MPLSYGYICRKIKLKISCLRKSHSGDVRPYFKRGQIIAIVVKYTYSIQKM